MYIKIFESRATAKSYTLVQQVTGGGIGNPYLEDENHHRIEFTENEIYHALDKLFKDKDE